ncbi:MAG: dNTP triphosphohydrolase [Chloroflexota bacterium]|nr:dNTP triphosphohydrolase [Chloroflexota bacterium]
MPGQTAAPARTAEIRYCPADAERRTPEPPKPEEVRDPWEIDRARVLHSSAFRRLQGKTQVFASGEDDFFRTRLTHSLEVSQIAKGIALRVGANPTLCEAAGLAHDIGHPPFGHAGERVLHHCLRQAGGFEGNAQNLRVLTKLEVKSELYDGLNLTRAALDAVFKYKRSYQEARAAGEEKFFYDDDLSLAEWICQEPRDRRPSFECQIVEWADDVAYSVHDVEDGMQSGLISLERLGKGGSPAGLEQAVGAIDNRAAEAVIEEVRALLRVQGERARKAARKTWASQTIHEMVRAASAIAADDQGRGPRYRWRLQVPEEQRRKSRILKSLAFELVFKEARVAGVQERAERIIRGLFGRLVADSTGSSYPDDFRERMSAGTTTRERLACDFIAGMTDDYAEKMYRRLLESP